MKKTLIALGLAMGTMISTAAVAAPHGEVSLDVSPASNGAWVTVTHNGKPVQGAIVNDINITPENGRVFVFVGNDGGGSYNFSAVTPDGHEVSKKAYVERD